MYFTSANTVCNSRKMKMIKPDWIFLIRYYKDHLLPSNDVFISDYNNLLICLAVTGVKLKIYIPL